MISKKEIVDYYKENIEKIQLPWDSSRRQYRMLCYDKTFRKIKRQIKKPEQLMPYIKEYKPLAIYYTVARWQNPKTTGPKKIIKGYQIADNLILGMDLIFDIDNPKDLDSARKTALKILDIVPNKLLYIVFSGSKGFHLVFKDDTKLPKNPKDRESYLFKKRKDYIVKHLDNIEFDKEMSFNTRQILKVPGTLTKTGAIVTKLTKKQLQKPFTYIIKNHISFLSEGKRSGMLRQMTGWKCELPSPRQRALTGDERSDPISSPNFYIEHFITNEILGCKNRFVLFLHYPLETTLYKRDIKRLMKKYNLGDIFVFKDEQEITALCPRTFQHKRLVKILNASKTTKKYEQGKFRKQFFAVNPNTKIINSFNQSETRARKSKGHSAFINLFTKYQPKETEGKKQIKRIKAKMQEKDGK